MFVTKKFLPGARSFGAWAWPCRCRCSTRWCRRSPRWRGRRRGRGPASARSTFPTAPSWSSGSRSAVGAGFEFKPILKPLEVVQGPGRGGVEPDAVASGQPGGRPRRERRRLPHRRVAEADRGRGRAREHDDRSGRGAADRPGHAVSLARSGDRGLHRLRRRLLARLQLRLSEHGVVEHAVHAAADGHQPARGVRADVRAGGEPGAARGAASATSAACSIRSRPRRGSCSAAWASRDRQRVAEYLDNLREIERRIQRAEARNATNVTLETPVGVPDSFEEHVEPDVRPAGGGLSGRRHAGVHVHAVARAESADVSEHRRHRAAPLGVAPRQRRRRRSRRTSRSTPTT